MEALERAAAFRGGEPSLDYDAQGRLGEARGAAERAAALAPESARAQESLASLPRSLLALLSVY